MHYKLVFMGVHYTKDKAFVMLVFTFVSYEYIIHTITITFLNRDKPDKIANFCKIISWILSVVSSVHKLLVVAHNKALSFLFIWLSSLSGQIKLKCYTM